MMSGVNVSRGRASWCRWRQWLLAIVMLLPAGSLWAGDASAEEGAAAKAEVKYLRIRRDQQDQPAVLETAVTRFQGRHDGQLVEVDLVGAVHVGEGEYYEQLNKLFRGYEVVLYELVAPEGTHVVPGKRRGNHPVSMAQTLMKNVLNLEFQLDRVDYSVANMVHADMSPDEFSHSMQERGESFFKMFLRTMGQAMSQGQQQRTPSDMEILVALVAKDRALRLKRLMAEQFENMEGQLSAINGPDGSTIITERNKKALQVLREQLAKGKKRLAVFYGAAHLSDMAERLEKDFGMKQQSQRWLVAWQIAPADAEMKPSDSAPAAQSEPAEGESKAPAESDAQAAPTGAVGR